MCKRLMTLGILVCLLFSFSLCTASELEFFVKGDGEKIELTLEEQQENENKFKLAEEYIKNKRKLPILERHGKINLVGKEKQSYGYTCGPAAARNLIWGYVRQNESITPGLYTPTEKELEKELGTTKSGTNFGPIWRTVLNKYVLDNNYTVQAGDVYTLDKWEERLETCIVSTIDKDYNYCVIANLNHGPLEAGDCVNEFYANKKVAHYVTVYGYANSNVYISDPHNLMSDQDRLYSTSYRNLAITTHARGIVW